MLPGKGQLHGSFLYWSCQEGPKVVPAIPGPDQLEFWVLGILLQEMTTED